MKIKLLAVGTRMPEWVEAGVEAYRKRLPREWGVTWSEIPLQRRGRNDNVDKLRRLESRALLDAAEGCRHRIALDVTGKALSTEKLAGHQQRWQQEGGDVAFLVGGPDGIDADVLAACTERWSLSAMTLPHPLVRVMLTEQLYRAWTITTNHPYHRS